MKTCPYKYMVCTLIGIDSILSAVHTCNYMNVIQQRTVRGYEEHVKIHTHVKKIHVIK